MVHISESPAGQRLSRAEDPHLVADLRRTSDPALDTAAIIARIAAASRLVDPRERVEELKLAQVALARIIKRESRE